MPGVLIELGFLSNKEEGEYLNSDEGQTEMARQIANSIIHYKRDYFNELDTNDYNKPVVRTYKPEPKEEPKPKEVADTVTTKPADTLAVVPGQALYKIQLLPVQKERPVK